MTRAEFEQAVDCFKRSLYTPLITFGVGVTVWVVAVIFFQASLMALGTRLFGLENAEFIRPALLLPVIAAGLLASAIGHGPVRKNPNAHCGTCGKFLCTTPAQMIVIASRNCPYCGGEVIDRPGSSDS